MQALPLLFQDLPPVLILLQLLMPILVPSLPAQHCLLLPLYLLRLPVLTHLVMVPLMEVPQHQLLVVLLLIPIHGTHLLLNLPRWLPTFLRVLTVSLLPMLIPVRFLLPLFFLILCFFRFLHLLQVPIAMGVLPDLLLPILPEGQVLIPSFGPMLLLLRIYPPSVPVLTL